MIKTYYLDDDNNIVPKEKSTHFIVQELDENGSLKNETFGMTESQIQNHNFNESIGEPSQEIKNILDNYTDKHGNYMFRK